MTVATASETSATAITNSATVSAGDAASSPAVASVAAKIAAGVVSRTAKTTSLSTDATDSVAAAATSAAAAGGKPGKASTIASDKNVEPSLASDPAMDSLPATTLAIAVVSVCAKETRALCASDSFVSPPSSDPPNKLSPIPLYAAVIAPLRLRNCPCR